MQRVQKRISIDPVLWDAVEAAAKARGLPVHIYVERALQTAIEPFQAIENAARFANNLSEIKDQIAIISDYIVDSMHSSDQN